jgi:hypothetical protein
MVRVLWPVEMSRVQVPFRVRDLDTKYPKLDVRNLPQILLVKFLDTDFK